MPKNAFFGKFYLYTCTSRFSIDEFYFFHYRRASIRRRRSGGIGRRAGLKIQYPQGCEGSIPSFGTIKKFRALGPEFFYSFLISYRLAVDVKMQVYHIHHDRSPLRDLMHDSLIAPCLVEKNVLVTVTPDESLVRLLPQATSRRQP
jgi:hypothetical protein